MLAQGHLRTLVLGGDGFINVPNHNTLIRAKSRPAVARTTVFYHEILGGAAWLAYPVADIAGGRQRRVEQRRWGQVVDSGPAGKILQIDIDGSGGFFAVQ